MGLLFVVVWLADDFGGGVEECDVDELLDDGAALEECVGVVVLVDAGGIDAAVDGLTDVCVIGPLEVSLLPGSEVQAPDPSSAITATATTAH